MTNVDYTEFFRIGIPIIEEWLKRHSTINLRADGICDDALDDWETDEEWTEGCDDAEALIARCLDNVDRYLAVNSEQKINNEDYGWLDAILEGDELRRDVNQTNRRLT